MKKAGGVLTEQELEIMKLVWGLDHPTVRDVYEALLERRKIAYTTVMTMMNLLVDKGHLKRTRKERAYVYRPSRPRSETVGVMVKDFVGRVFDGSAKPLLVQLVEDGGLSEKEVDELRAMIRESKKRG
jgi:predicted transcriptional regulator